MTEMLKTLSLLILTESCFDEYFVKFNFLDVDCLKSTISKCLGLSIILGSVMVKVPQIVKIVKNKSGRGINLIAVFLELFAMSATVSYSFVKGFPFSAWGDGIFLGIQTAAVAALVLYFGGSKTNAGLFVLTYISMLTLLMSGLTPISILWVLQACNIPVVIAGKMMQGYTNYKNQSTGQLSAITCFMLCFGATARIFTSVQETGDPIMVMTYCIASLANTFIVGQLLWYWNSEKRVKKER